MPRREQTTGGENETFANQREIDPADQVIVEGMAEDALDPEDRVEGTLADDDDIHMDVSARPASEVTAASEGSGDAETIDGLNELEEAVRQQAEDRALGDDEGFKT